METTESVQKHYKVIKEKFYREIEDEKYFDDFARVTGVNNLSYDKDRRGWFRIKSDGVRLSAPVGSKAALIHNEIVLKDKKNYLLKLY